MPDWWQSAVVYEVYPRSFQDSDGDGIGDLAGIESRLPYLEWLGVDAIWIAPFYVSPLADFGYDVADHAAIAPEYGTPADFDSLIAAAHRRGIRVLLDLVVSHTSIEHPWFRAHPDRYVWAEGPEPPNGWRASFGGPAWSEDERTGCLYLHSFYPEQPDVDWRNPELREAIADVVRFWVARDVDGFRVDAADRFVKDSRLRDDPHSPAPFPLPVHSSQQDLDLIHSRDAPDIDIALATLREAAGELPLIGEVYLPADRARRYLEHFDAIFAFDLLHAPWEAEALAAAIERSAALGAVAWVASNHDFPRAASRWGEANSRAAAVLLLTLGGCAFLYQGEEIGMIDGPGASPPLDRFDRDPFRHPMQWDGSRAGGFTTATPWLPSADPAGRNVVEQQADPDSILALFRDLIRVRREIQGAPRPIDCGPGLLAYRRSEHLVVINLTGEALPLEVASGSETVIATHAGAGGTLAAHAAVVLRESSSGPAFSSRQSG